MTVITTIDEFRSERAKLGKLALVPTMGALHKGHLSLIEFAKKTAPATAEDFNKYPRPLEEDLEKCQQLGVDLIFNPSAEEMYPAELSPIIVDLPQLTETLEGKHRPGHFRGVCQVVAKLFNIIQPQIACFGQKDFQQLRVLTAMVEALDWPIEVVGCPTLRDPDNLAMSSRNVYLSAEERERARAIPRALMVANSEVEEGEQRTNRLIATMQNILLDVGQLGRIPVSIDYVAAVDPITLKPVEMVTGPTVLAIAARVGKTRLIDNFVVTPGDESARLSGK
jgi:pantoate--beta-alanine ligase